MSNNPFVEQQFGSVQSSFSRRFPDVDIPSSEPQQQYGSWQQTPSSPYGGGGGYQQAQYQQQPQQQYGWNQAPQQTGYAQAQGYGGGGYAQSPGGFQPSSSFGQQLSTQMTGMPYGAQQQQYGGYPGQQQQQQQPQYQQQVISQFDPYAGAGDFLGGVGQQGQQQAQGQQGQLQTPGGAAPSGYKHPRDYVREHKTELEGWDAYAWKQMISAFDALKQAWGQRKREAEMRMSQLAGQGAYWDYARQQESVRLQGLAKEADSNHDSVAASSFQMQEVYSGYRQSGDPASKRRVKESINAALSSLPDWPSPQW